MTQLVDAGSSEQINVVSFSSLFARETGAQRTVGTTVSGLLGRRGGGGGRNQFEENVLPICEPTRVG